MDFPSSGSRCLGVKRALSFVNSDAASLILSQLETKARVEASEENPTKGSLRSHRSRISWHAKKVHSEATSPSAFC